MSKQAKRRQKRRYTQLLKRSKRTSCGGPARRVSTREMREWE
jgi:hypothetical protein